MTINLDISVNLLSIVVSNTNFYVYVCCRFTAPDPANDSTTDTATGHNRKRSLWWGMARVVERRVCCSEDFPFARGKIVDTWGRDLSDGDATSRKYSRLHRCWQQRFVTTALVVLSAQLSRAVDDLQFLLGWPHGLAKLCLLNFCICLLLYEFAGFVVFSPTADQVG